MLQQHAPMSHAFQTPSTGGRTYQISNLPELEFAIDISIFSDILELDDEDEQYFTRSLVYDFFVLARRTLDEMNSCLEARDIKQLRSKAQFLAGPSATLGVYKLKATCARIEQLTTVADSIQPEHDSLLHELLEQAKQNFVEAEDALHHFYHAE